MKSFSKLYVKYIIKKPIIFYIFLCLGVCLFLVLTLTLKLEIIEKYDAYYEDGIIKVKTDDINNVSKIYAYNNKNEKIHIINVKKYDYEYGNSYLHIYEEDINLIQELGSNFKIEISIGYESLFKRVFVKAGKG